MPLHSLPTTAAAATAAVAAAAYFFQLYDFFVETLGHRSLAFLELEYCEGGDLHGAILGGGQGDGGPSYATQVAATEPPGGVVPGVARGSTRGESLGMPAARIASVILGLCEGLEQLHEVRSYILSGEYEIVSATSKGR